MAEDCTVVFALDDAVTAASLQFSVGYQQPGVDIDGLADQVDCNGMIGGAFGSFFDDDAGSLDAAFIALGGFAGPVDVLSCQVTAAGVPSAADFVVTVSDASAPDLSPIVPTPAVVVSTIQCEGVTTTTTTSTTTSTTTTTSLPQSTTTTTLPGDGFACQVDFSLEDAVTAGSLQWSTSYANAAGEFEGSGAGVSCASAVPGAFASFQDVDAQRSLEGALISIGGVTGPTMVASCVFLADGIEPIPADFAVTVTDAATPGLQPISPLPTVAVDVDCGLGGTTTTTTSTPSTTLPEPACGNGVPEFGEDCDDGNASNNDDCLNDCTIADCGDGFLLAGSEECDNGLANSDTAADACRTDCSLPFCGDAVTDSGEGCDDGIGNSDTNADACRTDCTQPFCGDGVADSGEECDDGAANSNADPDVCRTTCENDYVCGDADGNGSVSVVDAQFALQSGIGLAEGCPLVACDANGDGNVSVLDAQRILAEAVGLPSDLYCALLVTLSVDDGSDLGSIQVDVDYSATGEDFLGAGGEVDCTNLVGGGSFAAFNNDVALSVLTVGLISTQGFSGPVDIVECRFRAVDDVPDAADITLTVSDAADTGGSPVSAPAVSIDY